MGKSIIGQEGLAMKMTMTMTILLLAASAVGAQSYSYETPCGNDLLAGDYGFTLTGTRPSGPAPGAPIETVVGVAMTHFDGNGNLTQTDNIKGSISGFTTPDRMGSGTYTVNADCSGTMTLSSPGSPTLTLQIVVVDNGNEVRTAVVAPPPVMVTSNGRKVWTRIQVGGFFMSPDGRRSGPAQESAR
jgi:hypothetical protein